MISRSDVEKILIDKKIRSGGNCGTYPVGIMQKLGVEYKILRPILNQLYKEKLITIHEGQHGKLIKWKGKVTQQQYHYSQKGNQTEKAN